MAKLNLPRGKKVAPKKFHKVDNEAAKLGISPFSRSKVDIIIPFHGQYEKVARLIDSIILTTRSNPYQITIVDDASPNADFVEDLGKSDLAQWTTLKTGRKLEPMLFTIRLDEQVGFGGALAAGYEATKHPWCIFMHSDVVVEQPGWMIEMGRTLLRMKDQDVRMVSARADNPGTDVSSMLKGSKDTPVSDAILKEGHIPMYCAMCHRDLFKHTRGFIKSYPFGWYEDEEFAFRMRHYGMEQAICGKSWVRHEGGKSVQALWEENKEAQQIMEENRDLCLADMRSLLG